MDEFLSVIELYTMLTSAAPLLQFIVAIPAVSVIVLLPLSAVQVFSFPLLTAVDSPPILLSKKQFKRDIESQ